MRCKEIFLLWLALEALLLASAGKTKFERLPFSEISCPPGTRRSNMDKKLFQCVPVSTDEIQGAIQWLANPYDESSFRSCKKATRVQNFDVCEDDLFTGSNKTCVIWSVIATQYCDDIGTLEFERYWAKRGCQVELYHYMMYIDGQLCKPKPKDIKEVQQYWDEFPNMKVHRLIVWARRCYICFYKEIFTKLYGHDNDRSGGKNDGSVRVNVLKVQSRVKVHGGEGLGVKAYHPEFLYRKDFNTSTPPSANDVMSDVYDGVQFAILSDLYLYTPLFMQNVGQLAVTLPFTKQSLIDNLGRESENGFNMWATAQLLSRYHASVGPSVKHSLDVKDRESAALRPLQLIDYLSKSGVDPERDHFVSSTFALRTASASASASTDSKDSKRAWRIPWEEPSKPVVMEVDPRDDGAVRAVRPPYYTLPAFCTIPEKDKRANKDLEANIRLWIEGELQSRCQPERMWLPCERKRSYAPFLPCPQQLKDAIAFDLAVARGWCDFNHPVANIQPLESVTQPGARFTSTDRPSERDSKKPRVRIAFFFTVYADAPFVRRLMKRLYSKDHYYLLHVDPSGSSPAFEAALQTVVKELCGEGQKPNIVLAKDVPIIYGAATASILLSRAMSWFHRYAIGWDYFVPLTGSDYPLVSLADMEAILGHKTPHMPFVMAWDWATSQSIRKLRGSDPGSAGETLRAWIEDEDVQASLDATWKERGNKKHMGDNLMEVRAYSYAPPLTCNHAQGFYRLDTRGYNNTQWLFPREGALRNGKARAMTRNPGNRAKNRVRRHSETNANVNMNDVDNNGLTNFDGKLRLWRKSDPGTSGAYDRASVRYIVDSEEGRKYYHFFKHMLLGSEEHYYVSLLYNWPRTKAFVTDIASQSVWNTWALGSWAGSLGGFRTHTHYLTDNEMSILRGLGKRGVFFGRKFGSKNKALLDQIDAFIDAEGSQAGQLWSGYFGN